MYIVECNAPTRIHKYKQNKTKKYTYICDEHTCDYLSISVQTPNTHTHIHTLAQRINTQLLCCNLHSFEWTAPFSICATDKIMCVVLAFLFFLYLLISKQTKWKCKDLLIIKILDLMKRKWKLKKKKKTNKCTTRKKLNLILKIEIRMMDDKKKKMENKIKEMTINGMNIHRVYRLIILTFFVKFNWLC